MKDSGKANMREWTCRGYEMGIVAQTEGGEIG